MDGEVRYAPDVPQLREDAASDAVCRARHLAPTGDLVRRKDSRVENITLAFPGNRRPFRDDQSGRRALGIVERDEFVCRIVFCARPGEWRHNDAVREQETGKIIAVEEVGHGSSFLRIGRLSAERFQLDGTADPGDRATEPSSLCGPGVRNNRSPSINSTRGRRNQDWTLER